MPLSANYKANEAEPRWVAEWQASGIYQFDRKSQAPVYSIDTPPKTVSGYLHLGHVYSYSQADFFARFWRMNGYNVFYPMGYDDNGLPTDRLVQRWRGIRPQTAGREEYIKACLEVSEEVEKDYLATWQRMGLSVDWRYHYRSIDADARRISQYSFVELHRKGLVYRGESPAIWCPECGVSIAQAELDDKERTTEFVTLTFFDEEQRGVPIATTRPELLAACVAVFIHPGDERYAYLLGKQVRVPFYEQWVPVLADEQADPKKGTGVVMCCTFGDQVDVEWQRLHHLPVKTAIDRAGRMTGLCGEFAGLSTGEARKQITARLESLGLVSKREPLSQSVRVHERCDTPVEYLMATQWFVKVLEAKPQLLALGEQVIWHPAQMAGRYREWVENLHWDWCITRQRAYGVPIPVWYCEECGELRIAREEELPVDPVESQPSEACSCGSRSFVPERDTMDTWATSSMTPEIAGKWLDDPDLFKMVYPYALRPQAHEIIRTWAFYTLVKAYYHLNGLPWKDVAISGWVVSAPGAGKISASKGGGETSPQEAFVRYSADAVRYWAGSSSLGRDTLIGEEKIQAGRRLVTKLWNVARFSERFLTDYRTPTVLPQFTPADRWLLSKLQILIRNASTAFRGYEYASAKTETEEFFWHDLADNYIEMAKQRLYDETNPRRPGAQYCLYASLLAALKLFAPFMPFITEEIYQGMFVETQDAGSLHRSAWPQPDERFADQDAESFGSILTAIASAVKRFKSEKNISLGASLDRLQLACDDAKIVDLLQEAHADLTSVTRATQIDFAKDLDADAVVLESDGPVQIAVMYSGK